MGALGPTGDVVLYRLSRIGRSITDRVHPRDVLGSSEVDYVRLGLSIGEEHPDRLLNITVF